MLWDNVQHAIEPEGGLFRGGEIDGVLPVDVAADGHAIVLGPLQLRDQPRVPRLIVREGEHGRLEPERTELRLQGRRDLRVFAESKYPPPVAGHVGRWPTILDQRWARDAFSVTAARIRAFNAASSIFSPSGHARARPALP